MTLNFQCLGQFSYDKARELTEKEKDANPASCWGAMVASLAQLVNTEKTYVSLMYLVPNWFGRKDSLRHTYATLITEFRRIEDLCAKQAKSNQLDNLVGHLCGQLWHFVLARSKTTDFFEQVATMGSMKFASFDDLYIVISDISQGHQKNFHHPILSPIKSLFTTEIDIISHLLQAQIHMSQCHFLPTLLHLNDAHTKFNSSPATQIEKESRKFGFGSPSKTTQIPAVYQWLGKFKGLLVSKFSLYFHEVLSKQAPSVELKNITSKLNMDFYTKIMTFQRKADATNISLLLDAKGLQEPFKGLGYQLPQKFSEPLSGIDGYPAIFSYPGERPIKHLPALVTSIQDRMKTLASSDKPVYLLNEIEKTPHSYYLSRVDPLITLVVIFESKKSEKDSYVNNFIQEMTILLRLKKLFTGIKPGKG